MRRRLSSHKSASFSLTKDSPSNSDETGKEIGEIATGFRKSQRASQGPFPKPHQSEGFTARWAAIVVDDPVGGPPSRTGSPSISPGCAATAPSAQATAGA